MFVHYSKPVNLSLYRFCLSATLPFFLSHFYPYRINSSALNIWVYLQSHSLSASVSVSLSTVHIFFFSLFFYASLSVIQVSFPTLFWFFQLLSISDKLQRFFQIQHWNNWSNLEYVMMLFKCLQSTVEKEEPMPLAGYFTTSIFLTGSAL